MNILLPIKPKYAKKIISKEKKYEFRKQKPKLEIKKVFIYEGTPSKKIIGYFTIKNILSGSPEDIWNICKNSAGIDKKEYFAYCADKEFIYAIYIDRVFKFEKAIDPFETFPDFKPPQNFLYLDDNSIILKEPTILDAENANG